MKLTQSEIDLLNEQLNVEMYSAYLYLSMAAHFEAQSLKGIGKWLQTQAKEEVNHGMKIYRYMLDRDAQPELLAIDKPPHNWKSALAAFEDALKHEQRVTKAISVLAEKIDKTKDRATQVFLEWYVTEQVEEEAQVKEIIDKLKLVKGDGEGLLRLDTELGKRD